MQTASERRNIPRAYEPKSVEGRVYKAWVDGGYFTPVIDPAKKPFVVIMPPPNVTGELHMGHALTTALEDLMVRWHRMRGEPTLFLPGSDHAGIATQVVVERMLASDGVSRHDIGRERFVERVWSWVDQYGSRIDEQLKRLGASCDWTRKAFTLDEGPSRAVRTTFVNLYKKGLIYRGERMTSWCPRCRTALSDLEVKYRDEAAALYHIRYDLEDPHRRSGEGRNPGGASVTIATTRPETLLGDTAVAVNPEDERFSHLVGRKTVLPVLGRVIPIIADEAVEVEFGTGALKVTPGHDPNDFEIGQRHDLPTVNVMELDGSMNENAGPYRGQTMAEARENIVRQLDEDGLLERVEPYHHSVGHCDRCDETVEPIVTRQWWMKMEPLARPAREAVANGRIDMVPERFARVYFNWMDNIRDWCVSRQLWWGHRLPVWYCRDCDEVVVEMRDPESCTKCGSVRLERDPDVLDTWFSSALWPHSTLGWPDETEDLAYFYPGTVMETGHDILFFWVARMAMMGLENMGDIPFETVYLHGLVRDPEGVKMSKSKGNVMDPLDLIDLYGADALRFALTGGNSPGNDMRLNEQKMEASRNFANKLWNAARFVMSNLDDRAGMDGWHDPKPVHRQDRWILSRLSRTAAQVDGYMKEFQFGEAQRVIHDFLWGEYCDWYIEMAKIRMRSGGPDAHAPLPVLAYVLERVLRLLHPFMPFVTEEVWQNLVRVLPEEPDRPEALIIAPYPEPDESLIDVQAESEMDSVIEVIRAVRNLRAEFRIDTSTSVLAAVDAPLLAPVLEAEAAVIKSQGGIDPLIVGSDGDGASGGDTVALVLTGGTVTVPLGGMVDLERERARLAEELQQLKKNLGRLSTRLADEQFLSKAPEDVIERERQRLTSGQDRSARIEDMLARLGLGIS